MKTVDLIQDVTHRYQAQVAVAEAQRKSGDLANAKDMLARALKTAETIQDDPQLKSLALVAIADAQAKAGDVAGANGTLASARKTADYIKNVDLRHSTQQQIAEGQTKAALTNNSASLVGPVKQNQVPIEHGIPVITVGDWLRELDDDSPIDDCALNTPLFLDLVNYMKSIPPSDKPQPVFDALYATAEKTVKAQNVIEMMLKQQAKN